MPGDPRPDLVEKAICAGQIQWKAECVKLFRADPEMKSFTEKGVDGLLMDFVKQKGPCRYREERSELWLEVHPRDPWWYFAVVEAPPFKEGLFVKMKLLWDEGDKDDEAFVEIISVHEEKK